MRIYHPSPDITVVFMDDISAKVDIYWTPDKVVIKQPNYMGGRIEKPLSEYDNFGGDLRTWVLSLREQHKRK